MAHFREIFSKTIKSQSGMSLVEILIALTLLGLFGTFIAGKVFDQFNEGKVKATTINIQNLRNVLQEYRRHCGLYPTTEQGLDALINKPTTGRECKRYAPNGYIADGKLPKDAWDNEYDYVSDGKTFRIISYGADLDEGGEGFDADIDSSKL